MKLLQGILIPAFLVSSITLCQERYPRLLDKVDLSGVARSAPGAVPANSLKFDPLVAEIIRQVNLDSLIATVRILSGEDTAIVGGSSVLIRERGGQIGGDLAAEYIKQRLASYNLEVFEQVYSSSGRNVYARQSGYLYPEKEYILCAHYDAIAENSADDDASGTAGVLEAARILSNYDPKYTVVYAFWDEEEQGLVGSEFFASRASSSNEQIQGVIDMDMIAWDGNGDYLADIHARNTANSNELANLMVVVDYLYDLPVKPVIYNPGTWQSDHSVFWNHGWGAVLVIEAYYGGDLNPYYHGPDDRIGKFNLPYFNGMSKLSIAALATLLEVTNDTLIAAIAPDVGYQTYKTDIRIRGVNTHFQENAGATKIWLSKGIQVLNPDSIWIASNTSLTAYFDIPVTADQGAWDVNVETARDGIVTKESGFTILPPPAIVALSPESLSVTLVRGETKEYILTLSNPGSTNLYFTASPSGKGGALQFDGIDDLVRGSDTGFPIGGSDRTIEVWFRRIGQPVEEGTLFGYGNWGSDRQVYEIFFHPERLDFSQWGGSCPGTTIIKNDQWYHGAAVNSGSNLRLYLDGELECSNVQDMATVSNGSFVIGKAPSGYDDVRRFNGVIDEVRIWNYARTGAEIQEAMGKELTGTEPGLAGYWQFNETSGLTAYDLSPNANHGSLIGGPMWVSSSAPIAPLWLVIRPDSGVCLTHSSMSLVVSIDGTRLDVGTYLASLRIGTNDPFHPAVTVPIHVEVSSASAVGSQAEIPTVFNLYQNYPNPFNPSTTIRYGLPERSHVILTVFNTLGQQVAALVKEEQEAGYHEAVLDASGLASGVYLYRLRAGDFVQSKRMLILK